MRVMFVDTDTTFRKNLCEKIKEKGLEVLMADTVDEALDLLADKDIDVTVLNMKELKANGIHLMSLIKEVRPYTEVVLLTTPSLIHLSIEAMKLGAFDDLLMPPDIGDLQRMIIEAGTKKKEKEDLV